jgi:ATP-dependent DNA helicase DinG
MARMLEGYEDRPGQLAMARAVERALDAERPLFVEAGTGTGKTLGYLVPAVLSGKKVVISTATHALQEQIFVKDLPLVATALAPFGLDVRAAMMKGLSNYACKRRLRDALLTGDSGGGPLAAELEAIRDWSRDTDSGDRSELVTLREGSSAWSAVQSGTDTRIGAPCTFYDECFVTQMKRAAEDAQIVVVNHHLYCADLALRRTRGGELASVLPPHAAVVFDEAHQLEDIATTFFGVRLSTGRFEALVRDVRRALSSDASAHRIAIERAAAAVVRASTATFAALVRRVAGGADARRAVVRADLEGDVASEAARLDDALTSLAAELDEGPPLEGASLGARRARDLQNVLRSIQRGVGAGAGRGAQRGARAPFDYADGDGDSEHEAHVELDVAPVGFRDDELGHAVAWLDVRDRAVSLGASPIDVGRTFREALFGRVPSVVCTSATLAAASAAPATRSESEPERAASGRFQFFRGRRGAPAETEELLVP